MDMFSGKETNSGVVCGVNTCHYHDDNYCTASKIEVLSKSDDCESSDDTMCKTYRCRK